MGPVGPRWASCWPHEPCYVGRVLANQHFLPVKQILILIYFGLYTRNQINLHLHIHMNFSIHTHRCALCYLIKSSPGLCAVSISWHTCCHPSRKGVSLIIQTKSPYSVAYDTFVMSYECLCDSLTFIKIVFRQQMRRDFFQVDLWMNGLVQ